MVADAPDAGRLAIRDTTGSTTARNARCVARLVEKKATIGVTTAIGAKCVAYIVKGRATTGARVARLLV
jgi:AmiR/NasT family two-component response regulator